MKQTHYGILNERGMVVGSVWAYSVTPKNVRTDGFWFSNEKDAYIASAHWGYQNVESGEIVLTPRAEAA